MKQWYARPGDRLEVPVDGFVIDIVRGDLLVEIQTQNFNSIKRKLNKLLTRHKVRLVFPIPCEKWIIKQQNEKGKLVSRRKSPKHAGFEEVFYELVAFPQMMLNPNFSLELLLIQEEEVRRYDATRAWRRRGWVTCERRLLEVIESRVLEAPSDMAAFILPALVEPFTTSDIATAAAKFRRLAQKMVYCLRLMNCIAPAGKRDRSIEYVRIKPGGTTRTGL